MQTFWVTMAVFGPIIIMYGLLVNFYHLRRLNIPKRYYCTLNDLYDLLEENLEESEDQGKREKLIVLRERFSQFLLDSGAKQQLVDDSRDKALAN